MRRAEDTEALAGRREAAQALIGGADAEIEAQCSGFITFSRELGEVTAKNRIQLLREKAPGIDDAVCFCGHVEGQGFHRRAFGAPGFHQLRIGREAGKLFCRAAYVQMVRMTFAADIRIRRKNDLRLEVTDDVGYGAEQIPLLIEAAIGKGKKTQVFDAQEGGGASRFLLTQGNEPFRSRSARRVSQTEAAVGTDGEAEHFAERGKLCHRGTRSDLDIIRMWAEKEEALILFQLRQRNGCSDNEGTETHACFAPTFLASSSRQMRSYSGSSRI